MKLKYTACFYVLAGRLNKFEEYVRHEKMLQQKLVDTKESTKAMRKNFEEQMRNIVVKRYQTKKW